MVRLCSAASKDRRREAINLTEFTRHTYQKTLPRNSARYAANIVECLVGVLKAEDVPEKIVRQIPGPGSQSHRRHIPRKEARAAGSVILRATRNLREEGGAAIAGAICA